MGTLRGETDIPNAGLWCMGSLLMDRIVGKNLEKDKKLSGGQITFL